MAACPPTQPQDLRSRSTVDWFTRRRRAISASRTPAARHCRAWCHAATPDDPGRLVPNPAKKAAARARHAEILAAAAEAQGDASLAALRNPPPAPPPASASARSPRTRPACKLVHNDCQQN
jgi:hypothetical protein